MSGFNGGGVGGVGPQKFDAGIEQVRSDIAGVKNDVNNSNSDISYIRNYIDPRNETIYEKKIVSTNTGSTIFSVTGKGKLLYLRVQKSSQKQLTLTIDGKTIKTKLTSVSGHNMSVVCANRFGFSPKEISGVYDWLYLWKGENIVSTANAVDIFSLYDIEFSSNFKITSTDTDTTTLYAIYTLE